jgi:hypothetical protein
MFLRLFFSGILLAPMLGGCAKPAEPEATDEPPPTSDATAAPVAIPPGDPRNEVIRTVRYPNHGEAKELGMAKFGGAMVNVTQYGPILEGGEGHFMVDVGRTKVAGVYVWIGMEEDGQRRKWPATPEPDGYHVHCSVPRPLEDEHALWVEIKVPDGKRYHGQYYIGER